MPLYLTFVDFVKAFDSVSHSAVMQALLKDGWDVANKKVLHHIYENLFSLLERQRIGFPIETRLAEIL